jgi:hypothetical protein
MNKKIVLELTVEELNQILGALGKLPYETSVHLINKIVKIAQEQLKE